MKLKVLLIQGFEDIGDDKTVKESAQPKTEKKKRATSKYYIF